ncbi:MAG: membrane protein insertion efficiency factor YidD [Ignavibacteriaceae bacterium]|jgi:putative membrane protein insertion efficiency factor|nr:membrane protein insertion efficiency factor YidD [Ignavibacteriaceae bacterium]
MFLIKPELDKMVKKGLLLFIKIYKVAISPFLGKACIYHPTCSVYSSEAIMKYGVIKGGFLSFTRILRCNPFAKGGFDPLS